MGLGKTVQALMFLQSIYTQKDDAQKAPNASLLVVPKSLLVNWQRERSSLLPICVFSNISQPTGPKI